MSEADSQKIFLDQIKNLAEKVSAHELNLEDALENGFNLIFVDHNIDLQKILALDIYITEIKSSEKKLSWILAALNYRYALLSENTKLLAMCTITFGDLARIAGNAEYAKELLYKGRQLACDISDNDALISATLNLGRLFLDQENYQQAENAYLWGLQKLENSGHDSECLPLHQTLGMFYEVFVKNYDKAIIHSKRALELIKDGNLQRKLDILEQLARLHEGIDELDDAIAFAFQALEMNRFLKNEIKISLNLRNLGFLHLEKDELQKAFVYYQEAHQLAENFDESHINEKLKSKIDLAYTYSRLIQWREALNILTDALSIAQEYNVLSFEIRIQNRMGECYLKRNIMNRAKEHYKNALELATQNTDVDERIQSLLGLAACENYISRGDLAIVYLKQALQIHSIAENPKLLPQIYGLIAIANLHLQNQKQAERYFRRAKDFAKTERSKRTYCAILLNYGIYTDLSDNVPAALEIYEKCLSIAREIKNHNIEGTIHNRLGQLYERFDDISLAKGEYFNAFNNRRKTGDRKGIVENLLSLARIAIKQGMIAECESLLPRIIKIANRWNLWLQEMEACVEFGLFLFYTRKEQKRSFYLLHGALYIAREHRDAASLCHIRYEIARFHQARGHFEKALQQYERELSIAQQNEYWSLELSLCENAAAICFRLGRLEESLEYAKRTVFLINRFRQDSPLEQHRINYMQFYIDIFRIAVDACLGLGTKIDALQFVEQAKSRALTDQITAIPFNSKIRTKSISGFLEKESELLSQVRVLMNCDLFELGSSTDDDTNWNVKEYNSVLLELGGIYRELKEINPLYVDLRRGTPANFRAIRKSLLA